MEKETSTFVVSNMQVCHKLSAGINYKNDNDDLDRNSGKNEFNFLHKSSMVMIASIYKYCSPDRPYFFSN